MNPTYCAPAQTRKPFVHNGLYNQFVRFANQPTPQFTPSVDIVELENAFQLEVAAPGFKKEDFTLAFDNNRLTISGERKLPEYLSENGTKVHRTETSYGKFERTFIVPKTVDAQSINAKYENGILLVTLPKSTEAKTTKNIAVH